MSIKIMGRNAAIAAAIASSALLVSACGSGSSHSASYDAGHLSGTQGAARQSGAGGANSPMSVEQACKISKDGAALAPKGAPTYIENFNADDYIKGCEDAFKEKPVGS